MKKALSFFCFVVGLMLFIGAGNAFSAKLYIYYPTTVNPKILERQLAGACNKINVMVFGKYKDFFEMVQSEKPDAIMVNTPLLQEFPDYSLKRQGVQNGKTTDAYILLSINNLTEDTQVLPQILGTVNFMNKKNMEKFVRSFLNEQPQIKYVPKIEDLLTVLNFKAVSAVLVPESYVGYFKSMSKLSLKETRLPGKPVERISVALRHGSADALIIAALQKIQPETNMIFGVDTWK